MVQRQKSKSKICGVLAAIASILLAFIIFSYSKGIDNKAKCEYHFIDVGQGDCSMIISDNNCVVIDTGPSSAAPMTLEYISQYTNEIDILVLTHPHEDHIGGAEELLKEIGAKIVIMPDVATETVAFSRVLDAIEGTKAKLYKGVSGEKYRAGKIELQLLAPNSSAYKEINDYSIVLRAVCENTTVLFSADAEGVSEKEILNNYNADALKADILKVGHHGSSTSTTDNYLAAVSPLYAVISAGADNSYGHPSSAILSRLTEAQIKTFRTDKDGSIIFYSDGNRVYTN